MPAIDKTILSPSCKFKLLFCSKCNEEIQQDSELKCDNCTKYFHNHCLNSTTGGDDLILLCIDCVNNKIICTKKDQLDIKSTKAIKTLSESQSQPEPRKLRQRAISVDYSGTNKRKGFSSKATLTDKRYCELELKLNTMQKQIEFLENRECKCFVLQQNKQINSSIVNINTVCTESIDSADLNDDVTKDMDLTGIITKIDEEQKTIINRLNKIDKSLLDLAVFERSNHDGLMSTISNNNEIDAKLRNLCEVLKVSDALQETNMTAMIESQKIITEHETRIGKCETKMFATEEHHLLLNNNGNIDEKVKKVKEDFEKLFSIMNDFAFTLKRHNNTIKTHFFLNEAYNEEITTKIQSKLNNIALVNKSNNTNNKVKIGINNHGVLSNLGTMVLKSMQRNNQQSDKIKIQLRNLKTNKSIEEIQIELGLTLERCSEKIKNIKWHTNKINFDPDNHNITAAILIAILPENINVTDLSKRVCNFFGKSTG